MMMIPRRRNDFDLWDEMFRDPFFTEGETKLMKTDIKEKKDKYLVNIDLPGYEKENIKIEIEDGYLTVHATTDSQKEEKEEGKFVRKERYLGECSRSFYIGEDIKEEDIRASLKNGTLQLEIPKKEEQKALLEKKYIPIDGE
ncbi:MAG: Hsp20/alpha crystallin family protein [Clostridia bacterium]